MTQTALKAGLATLGLLASTLASATTMNICAGQAIPDGWVWVDSRTDYNACGNSYPYASGNQRMIEKLTNQNTLRICGGQPIPAGWVATGTETNYAACNNQYPYSANNVLIISNLNPTQPSQPTQPPQPATCSLSSSQSNVAFGSSVTFTINAANIPANSSYYWYGSRDNIADATGQLGGTAPGTFSIANTGGASGYYQRYAVIRDSQNKTVCTTNTVSVSLQPNPNQISCSLDIDVSEMEDRYFVSPGQTATLTAYAQNLPPGTAIYWYGTKNDATDLNGQYGGNIQASATTTFNTATSGQYFSSAKMISPQGQTVCQTNSLRIVVR